MKQREIKKELQFSILSDPRILKSIQREKEKEVDQELLNNVVEVMALHRDPIKAC